LNKPRHPLFLARETYRKRRINDVARLLPVLGLLALCLPVLWGSGPEGAPPETTAGITYLFAVWSILILAAAFLSRRLGQGEAAPDPGKDGP
jgi:hypothetical protein